MKKIIKENYRVVVEPDVHSWLLKPKGKSDEELCAEHLLEEVKRHIDSRHAFVLYDTKEICEFCETNWDVYQEDEPEDDIVAGLPGCCNKAQEEFYEQREEPNEKTIH